MKRLIGLIALTVSFLVAPSHSNAQWSVGAPGERVAPAGERRFAFLVFANPRPGQEQAFNDWYDYEHLGDLLQLPGWTGGQRFRLVTQLNPRPTASGYGLGYLALWDQEANDPTMPRRELDRAQDGGKARRSNTFDYLAGAAPKALYEVLGPRRIRPDGQAAFIPGAEDMTSVRLNRYIVLDFADRPQGLDAEAFEHALNGRISNGLVVPGWIAAQRLRALPTPGSRGNPDEASPFPSELIVWEVQAVSAQAAQDLFAAATTAGAIPSPANPVSAIMTYWQPIGPYIDRSDFVR